MSTNKLHHEHDVGYKHIFSHRQTFVEFLRSFVNKEWVKLVKENDLILVEKSYILHDFEEEESDIVYRINIDGKDVIFYVLLEFQSRVDFQMPMRLLFYMTEIWRDILKNTSKTVRRRKDFVLPAIVPIVLYNGKNKWTAKRNFKELLAGYEIFEDNILDFKYILFDINKYKEEELFDIANLVSVIFLLDQSIDEEELYRRLRKIIYILKRISPEQFSVFKAWLRNIIKPRLDLEYQKEIEEVLNKSRQEEVEYMIHNIEKTLDKIEKKGKKEGKQEGKLEGRQEGKLEVARNLLKMGMDVITVIKATGLDKEEIEKLRESMH